MLECFLGVLYFFYNSECNAVVFITVYDDTDDDEIKFGEIGALNQL